MGGKLPFGINNFIRSFWVLVFILAASTVAFGQSRSLAISGVVKEEKTKLSGVKVSIIKGTPTGGAAVVKEFVTDGSGKFDYPLEVNSQYIVEISKPGYVSKSISYNTAVPDADNFNWTFDFIVELFRTPEGVDVAVFKNPVAKVQYNKDYSDFDYDLDYSMEFKKKEDQVMKQIEQVKKQESKVDINQVAEEKREQLEEQRKQDEVEKAYQSAMAAANKDFEKGEYEKALASYKLIKENRPSDKALADKIKETETLVAGKKLNDKIYNDALAKGDSALKIGDYDFAYNAYKKAAQAKPTEKYPEQKIEEVNRLVKESRKEDEQYFMALGDGNKAFQEGRYEDAIASFKRAIAARADNQEARDKIKLVEEKMAFLKKEEASYQAKIDEGDKLYKSSEYEKALIAYQAAAKIKPNETYPPAQIKLVQQKLEEDQAKNEEYSAAIKRGDGEYEAKNYSEAIKAYQQAQLVKPQERYPAEKIASISKMLQDKEKAQKDYNEALARANKAFKEEKYEDAKAAYEEALKANADGEEALSKLQQTEMILAASVQKAEQYNSFIKSGDDAFKSGNYLEAKTAYEKASELKPEEKYPKDRIADSEKRLGEQLKQQEIDNAYAEAIASADKELQGGNHQAAVAAYEKAKGIKPSEKYPSEQLDKLKKVLKETKKVQDEIAKIISKGEKAYSDGKYADAKAAYEEALKLDNENAQAKAKLAEAENKLAEIAKKEQDYIDLLASAENAFNNQDYKSARAGYEKALTIRPDDKVPQQKIEEIFAILTKEGEIQKVYDEAIREGDLNFGKNEFRKAKTAYETATKAKPEEAYPKNKIEEINGLIEEKAAKEKAYQGAITAADKSFKDGALAEAKAGYQQAIEIRPGDQYAAERIKEVDAIQQKQIAKESTYQELILAADNAYNEENWKTAVETYNKASVIKPGEQYPKDKAKAAEEKQKEADKVDEEYRSLIASADKDFSSNKFTSAKETYIKAMGVKPSETYPQKKVDEIDLLYEQLKQAAQKKEEAQLQKQQQKEAERLAREEEAAREAEAKAAREAERERKEQEAIEAAKEQARLEAEEKAKKEAEKAALQEEINEEQESIRAEKMQRDAEKLLEEEIAKEEERLRAEAERMIREELEAKLNEEQQKIAEEQAAQKAQEAQEKRKAELEARKKAEEETFQKAQEVAQAKAEEEKRLKAEQLERERLEREAKEQAAKEKAAQEEAERLRLEEEARLAREEKEREEKARQQAELEARKQAEKEAYERAQAEAQARLEAERKAKEEREAAEKAAREAKIEEAKRKAEEERLAREEAEIKRKAEAAAAAEAAKAKKEAEEQARIQEENKRKEFTQNRAEEVKSKAEFEKTAKEIAISTAQENKTEIYNEVKEKLEAEYAGKFEELEKSKEPQEEKPKEEPLSKAAFKTELAQKYPVGITEETVSESGKKITKLVVNRQGIANEYQKVKWNWGGVYYFKNGESISKAIFDTETTW